MIWPFKRKPKVIDRRKMNEDWKVGDLAVCVEDNWPNGGPAIGEVNRVASISDVICDHGRFKGMRVFCLAFTGAYRGQAFEVRSFRKVRRDAAPCEEEFAALIKKGRTLANPKEVEA